jgi:tRNA-uridine 2-sulfurtransferase
MKLLVGLSGGVDSAIAAYLLKQQGHDLCCAFMRNWDSLTNNDILGNPTLNEALCTQEADYQDAQAVAKMLDLPLIRIDFIKEYWDDVFSIFLKEYEKGRTPNPDILCNKSIKFDAFLQYALDNGFDGIATGHYARVLHGETSSQLLKAIDTNKDQSYFLAHIQASALRKSYFPLGELTKPAVRTLAEQLNLGIAKKKDSTGICFIGEREFRKFLSNYLPTKPGKIIDLDTHTILGQHSGVLYYTLGQRKGLDIHAFEGPWFVCGKDVHKNELYVVKGEHHPLLKSTRCRLEQVNWFNPDVIYDGMPIKAKFRYRQKDQEATLILTHTETYVSYPQGILAVTPGQEAVLYLGDVCLGGAVIDEIYFGEKSHADKLKEHLNAS